MNLFLPVMLLPNGYSCNPVMLMANMAIPSCHPVMPIGSSYKFVKHVDMLLAIPVDIFYMAHGSSCKELRNIWSYIFLYT